LKTPIAVCESNIDPVVLPAVQYDNVVAQVLPLVIVPLIAPDYVFQTLIPVIRK
jgi:hypothetical protein